jgi:hypothetical protein
MCVSARHIVPQYMQVQVVLLSLTPSLSTLPIYARPLLPTRVFTPIIILPTVHSKEQQDVQVAVSHCMYILTVSHELCTKLEILIKKKLNFASLYNPNSILVMKISVVCEKSKCFLAVGTERYERNLFSH